MAWIATSVVWAALAAAAFHKAKSHTGFTFAQLVSMFLWDDKLAGGYGGKPTSCWLGKHRWRTPTHPPSAECEGPTGIGQHYIDSTEEASLDDNDKVLATLIFK